MYNDTRDLDINYTFGRVIDERLRDHGLKTVADVTELTRDEVLEINGIGNIFCNVIEEYLIGQGFGFKGGDWDPSPTKNK